MTKVQAPSSQRRARSGRADETRHQLLAAAQRVVTTEGIAGASSRAIAGAAGTNLQAITYHFGSKDELIAEALFDELARRVRPVLARLQDRGGVDPVVVMRDAVAALLEEFERQHATASTYLEALVTATRPGPYQDRARQLLRALGAELAALIAELRRDGVVPGWVDPQAMASVVLGVANGIALGVTIDEASPPVASQAAQFALLLVGVAGDGRG